MGTIPFDSDDLPTGITNANNPDLEKFWILGQKILEIMAEMADIILKGLPMFSKMGHLQKGLECLDRMVGTQETNGFFHLLDQGQDTLGLSVGITGYLLGHRM